MSVNSGDHVSSAAARDADTDKLFEELQGNIHVFPGTMASFLSIMVPSCAPDVPRPLSRRAFSKYKPPKGKQVKIYTPLLSGLRAAVSGFQDDKKPKFFPLRRKELPFPFPEVSNGHSATTPDLSVSFPGDTSTAFDWQNTAMFVYIKGNRVDDPFDEDDLLGDPEHGATIVQLAVDARALMAVHGHCAVFALGIYATACRIIRFDHACAVASPAFSLKRHPEYLQQFFWRLSHPHGATVVGDIVGYDPTVRKLTQAEQDWLADSLRASGHTIPQNLQNCRRVECEGTRGEAAVLKAYFTVGFVHVSPRLMSQSTIIWRAVEDPRIPIGNGRSLALPNVHTNIVVFVVKDSWRRLDHRSEQDFFNRIERIPKCDRVGLPTHVVGCDLGDIAVRLWAAVSPRKLFEAIEAVHEQLEDESASESAAFRAPRPVPATIPPGSPPLPLQQTCTSHLFHGAEGIKSERSHTRFVTSIVGRPLTEFRNTRELCQAVRDAIAAHKTLWHSALVLHRDISPGNILIVDTDLCQSDFVGFLHDFHHSSTVGGGVERLATFESDRDVEYDTDYFMATELLESPEGRHEVDHDLESFFWVLLWVVLRHTKHSYVAGEEECTTLFGMGPNVVEVDAHYATVHKRGYLLAFSTDVHVWNNRPLTELLRDFRLCCLRSIRGRPGSVEYERRMTHNQVLTIFDEALAQDNWPIGNDGPRPFVAPENLTTIYSTMVEDKARSDLKKRKQDAVATARRPEVPDVGPRPRKRARTRR